MDFGKALEALNGGKKIRCASWETGAYIMIGSEEQYGKDVFLYCSRRFNRECSAVIDTISVYNVLAEDWETVDDLKKADNIYHMDFSRVLKAIKFGECVKRTSWNNMFIHYEFGIIYSYKDFIRGTRYNFSEDDIFAMDWVVVEDLKKVNSDDVLKEFKECLEKMIHATAGTPGNGHMYLIRCIDELNKIEYSKAKEV